MKIFLRKIPPNTKQVEISEFVAAALKRGFFRSSGRILKIEILALQDMSIGTIEYHGLVTLNSEIAAHTAVSFLKSRRLNGRIILVRPYFQRSWYNDPRQKHPSPVGNTFLEKRKGDRRRGHYLHAIKNISDHVNSEHDFFHREVQINFMTPLHHKDSFIVAIEKFKGEHTTEEFLSAPLKQKPINFLTENETDSASCILQVYTEDKVSFALLEYLKTEFAGLKIQFWILPVIEKGEI